MKLPSTRRAPYTERGIARVRCVKCGRPSRHQWRICSTSQWTAVCRDCDIEANLLMATWAFGKRKAAKIIRKYIG